MQYSSQNSSWSEVEGKYYDGFLAFSFSSLICPFLRPSLSSEAVMPEPDTGNQTAVCPDRGAHCPKEGALLPNPFLPNSPSLKFGSNERDTMLETLFLSQNWACFFPKAKHVLQLALCSFWSVTIVYWNILKIISIISHPSVRAFNSKVLSLAKQVPGAFCNSLHCVGRPNT